MEHKPTAVKNEWNNTGEPRFKTDRQPFRSLIIVTIGLLLNKFNFALFQV